MCEQTGRTTVSYKTVVIIKSNKGAQLGPAHLKVIVSVLLCKHFSVSKCLVLISTLTLTAYLLCHLG